MKTLEFETTLQNGVIRLPDESIPDQLVRVKVWLEEVPSPNPKGNYDPAKLDAAFDKVAKLDPFREIEDVIEWQRRVRDEWE